jgi:hypothetical protein
VTLQNRLAVRTAMARLTNVADLQRTRRCSQLPPCAASFPGLTELPQLPPLSLDGYARPSADGVSVRVPYRKRARKG